MRFVLAGTPEDYPVQLTPLWEHPGHRFERVDELAELCAAGGAGVSQARRHYRGAFPQRNTLLAGRAFPERNTLFGEEEPDACFVSEEELRSGDPDAVRNLRTCAPELPLIMLAGVASPEAELLALTAGADGILDGGEDEVGIVKLVRRLAEHRGRLSECHSVAGARRVLVVDDDTDFVLPVTREVMDRAGIAVATANNAEDGLRLMRSQAFSVLLTDLRMPGLSGEQLVDAALRFDSRVVPVVMTGFASLDSAVACLRAGAADFVTKPFDTSNLVEVIERAWRRSFLAAVRAQRPQRASEGMRVLLAGGDVAGSDELGDLLAAAPEGIAHVDRADSLDDCAAMLSAGPYDILLIDVDAPGRNLEDYARVHAAGLSLPVVALTSSKGDATAEQVLLCGAQDYLVRDTLSPELLVARLRHVIERQKVLADLERLAEDTRASDLGRWQVIERSLDAVLVTDDEDTILRANPAAELLFGRPATELMGSSMTSLATTTEDGLLDIVRPDGARRLGEPRPTRTTWRNRPATLCNIRDVTDRSRAAELERRLIHADRLASIGQLAAGVAHEINNPLAFLIGNTSMMTELMDGLDAALDELSALGAGEGGSDRRTAEVLRRHRIGSTMAEMREMLEDNVSGLERIRKVSRNLKVFSRAERDQVDRVYLNDVVDTACDLSFNEIRHRARLVKDLGEVPTITGDKSKLCQVLVNLLLNAAHAIEPGDAARNQIKVETVRGRDHVELRVTDTGSGIPREDLARIFDPFFTTKPRGVGTGLGLSLCTEIVGQHGGEIGVDSKVGRGSTFVVYVPLDTGIGLSPERAAVEEVAVEPDPERLRVLIVDDDTQVRRALRRMIEARHEVVAAEGGPEAIDLLSRDRRFDAILCDLMMPDADGVAVYQHLRAIAPNLAAKLAFVSGGSLGGRLDSLPEDEKPQLLKKPFSRQKLLDFVSELAAAELGDDTVES